MCLNLLYSFTPMSKLKQSDTNTIANIVVQFRLRVIFVFLAPWNLNKKEDPVPSLNCSLSKKREKTLESEALDEISKCKQCNFYWFERFSDTVLVALHTDKWWSSTTLRWQPLSSKCCQTGVWKQECTCRVLKNTLFPFFFFKYGLQPKWWQQISVAHQTLLQSEYVQKVKLKL